MYPAIGNHEALGTRGRAMFRRWFALPEESIFPEQDYAFTFGNAPRTNPDWRGPGQRTTDLAISKTERFGGKSVSFRVDVLNLFDDALFVGPVSTFGSSTFGQISAVGGFPRSLQFQIRVGW